MKKQDRKILYKLLEEWTRAEIMSRLAPIGFPDYGDYHFEMIKKEEEIRELMFGTGNLVLLGERWKLPMVGRKSKKKKLKSKNKSKKHS